MAGNDAYYVGYECYIVYTHKEFISQRLRAT